MRMKSEHRATRGGGCWVVEKEGRRERSERWSREILIPRESGGGPVRAPCPMRAVAVSACGLAVWSFTEFSNLDGDLYKATLLINIKREYTFIPGRELFNC